MKQTGDIRPRFSRIIGVKMTASFSNGSLLSIGQASDYLGMHPQSLRRAADDGLLECFTLPSGHRRFSLAQLRVYIGMDGA